MCSGDVQVSDTLSRNMPIADSKLVSINVPLPDKIRDLVHQFARLESHQISNTQKCERDLYPNLCL